jgi:hypothetical protein
VGYAAMRCKKNYDSHPMSALFRRAGLR